MTNKKKTNGQKIGYDSFFGEFVCSWWIWSSNRRPLIYRSPWMLWTT